MADRCTYCEEPITSGEWHPVATTREDGEVVVHAFCSESCRAAWRERQ